MALADSKKVQTMLNITGQQAQIVRNAVQAMKDVRTAYQAVNPDVTGTPLEGNVAALSTALNALDTQISGAIWTGVIAAIEPTHQNNALS